MASGGVSGLRLVAMAAASVHTGRWWTCAMEEMVLRNVMSCLWKRMAPGGISSLGKEGRLRARNQIINLAGLCGAVVRRQAHIYLTREGCALARCSSTLPSLDLLHHESPLNNPSTWLSGSTYMFSCRLFPHSDTMQVVQGNNAQDTDDDWSRHHGICGLGVVSFRQSRREIRPRANRKGQGRPAECAAENHDCRKEDSVERPATR